MGGPTTSHRSPGVSPHRHGPHGWSRRSRGQQARMHRPDGAQRTPPQWRCTCVWESRRERRTLIDEVGQPQSVSEPCRAAAVYLRRPLGSNRRRQRLSPAARRGRPSFSDYRERSAKCGIGTARVGHAMQVRQRAAPSLQVFALSLSAAGGVGCSTETGSDAGKVSLRASSSAFSWCLRSRVSRALSS